MPDEDIPVPPGQAQVLEPEKPSEEPKKSFLKPFSDYWIRVGVILAVGAVFELVTGFFTELKFGAVARASKWLGSSLDQLDPWNLFAVYFSFLLTLANNSESGIWYILRGDFLPEGIATYLWRIIPGVFYAAGTILSQSWINIITAAIAVGIGIAFVRKSDDPFLVNVLKVPVIGCVCLWILIKTMALANWAFGEALFATHLLVYTAFTSPLLLAMLKEREHHVTGIILKLIKR